MLQTKRFPEMLAWYKTVLMAKPAVSGVLGSFQPPPPSPEVAVEGPPGGGGRS